jgi:ABC-2 type transport system permease protein
MITGSDAGVVKPTTTAPRVLKNNYSMMWSKLVTAPGAERMGFLFSWKLTNRSKDFKLKVYPSLGYLVVYLIVMVMGNKNFSLEKLSSPQGKNILILIIYSISFLMITALAQMSYSEKFKASWMYFVTPIQAPGKIIAGSLKAAIIKFYFPIVLIISAVGIIFTGPAFIPNLVLGICNQCLIAGVMVYLGYRDLPFSLHQNQSKKSGSFIRGIFIMIVIGAIGFGHYLVSNFTLVVIIFALMSIIASWLMMDALKKTGWEKLRAVYTD